MLERSRARSTWALGLIAILCSYNLAYANVKLSENTSTPPARVRTTKLNNDGATKTVIDDGAAKSSTTDTSTKTVPANKKKSPTVKSSTAAANTCACNCSTKTGRATAAPGPWWDCVRRCLSGWGVSLVQLALCGVACGTANVPLCIACLAIDLTLIMFCSIGCEVYAGHINTSDEGFEPILVRKLPRNNRQKAERRVLAFAARK